MTFKNDTAYCGIYCPDCIHYRNRYSILAKQLKDHLTEIEFPEYASIKSPFAAGLENWDEFESILKTLAETKCNQTCRVGGGCSGKPCKIMECCQNRNYEGCWECTESDTCKKFDFLEPRCGDMPTKNIRAIQKYGLENWADKRNNFYIWQK